MIEMVKVIGQIINIAADLMRRFFFKGVLHHRIKAGKFQHQRFLALADSLFNLPFFQRTAVLSKPVQNGLNPYDRVQNIRARISLKRSEAIHIKHVILGCLIGQISVFDGRQTHNFRRPSGIFILYVSVLDDFLIHLIGDFRKQPFQPHHTALPGFERLAVFSVHGAKAKEIQPGIFLHQLRLSGTAEYLGKVKFLTLVHHIDNLIGMKQFHPLHDGGQVCGIVQRSAV